MTKRTDQKQILVRLPKTTALRLARAVKKRHGSVQAWFQAQAERAIDAAAKNRHENGPEA